MDNPAETSPSFHVSVPSHLSRATERDARITRHVATGMGIVAGAYVALGAARLVPKCREPVVRDVLDAAERLVLGGAAVASIFAADHVASTAKAAEEQARVFGPLLDQLNKKANTDRGSSIA